MIGSRVLKSGQLYFRVWAPKAKTLSLITVNNGITTAHLMRQAAHSYFELSISPHSSPVDYYYCIDNDKKIPDPASCWQPFGIHGPSRVYDQHHFMWEDSDWKGIPLADYLIYELHVGTFTQEGTFEAMIEKLPYLKNLGITAIELMPSVEFPGHRNWGYDGVYPYAPHHLYGGPDGLKKLISTSHQLGIAVVLDVVYNHLGPEGNYLEEFGYYFSDAYKVPWGKAINFDGPHSDHVRDYFIENALYWITEFHVDALRVDAIQGIFDFSARHFLEELASAVHNKSQILGRQIFVTVESDLNDARILKPAEMGGYGIDAQWNDDFHHALHTLITKSHWGYLIDFGRLSQLADCIKDGFTYTGQWSQYRQRKHGNSSKDIPGRQLIICMQNHDQIGNACSGKRLYELVDLDTYLLASTILFFTPNIPLLFMGQEWNASTPFYYFISYEDEKLGEQVAESYCKEIVDQEEKRNPQNPKFYELSKLNWSEITAQGHADVFRFYQKLIILRKGNQCLKNLNKALTDVMTDEEQMWMVILRREASDAIFLAVNFSGENRTITLPIPEGKWKIELSSSRAFPESYFNECFESQSDTHTSLFVPANGALIYSHCHT